MTVPRVAYIGAPPHGMEMLQHLLTLPCEVVYATAEDELVWPVKLEYNLGLNFLGTHKVPEEEVKRPRLGWVNFHPAPLPEFRGRNLCYHAIMTEAEYFGATVHYMSPEYDTGPLIDVQRFAILPSDTAGELHAKAITTLKRMFRQWVPQLLLDRVPTWPQDESRARYYRKEPINGQLLLASDYDRRLARAATYHPRHHAYVIIGGRKYELVPEA